MSDGPDRPLLENPLTVLPGISDKRQKLFSKLGVDSLADLLWLMPRAYEDWVERLPIGDLVPGQTATFQAQVQTLPSLSRRGRLTYLKTRLSDDSGSLEAIWFNQAWVADRLQRGQTYLFRGKIDQAGRTKRTANPDFRPADPGGETDAYLPVYPLTAGLYQSNIRQAVRALLDRRDFQAEETLPASVRAWGRLATADFALRRIHFPSCPRDIELARRRLAFEELFLVLFGLRALKSGRSKEEGPRMEVGPQTEEWLQGLMDRLPFQLTGSQTQVLQVILDDFRKQEPANRLIQGDVGSGKTLVAALAMAAACKEGYQSVLMAPTTILAGQHARTLTGFLEGSDLSIALLTGATPAAERRRILKGLKEQSIQILIGTHAVLEESVVFARLGCCVTDEQHRFGVRQRVSLTGRGQVVPHVLVMSATPIPRTLAMILYGDLDVSDIREMPKGRLAIKTYTATQADRPRIDGMIRRQLEEGGKVYIVCPVIEDSEELPLASAQAVHERLSQEVFPDRKVALMHGRLKAGEKAAVMEAFHAGEIHILVSTTVIEVGIDHPDASLLVVENAERFGLSQLHQLRGRVGRSDRQSYCLLVSDSQDPLVRERLRVLCRQGSGFDVADEDLRLRGPGDFFGVAQHGLPDFKVANLYQDTPLLHEAAAACDRILGEDPGLEKHENQVIMEAFRARYGERLARPGL